YIFGTSGGTSDTESAIIIELSGQDGATPINAHSTPKGGNSKSASFNSVTTTVDGCMILAFVGVSYKASSTTFSTPTGFTDQGGDQSALGADSFSSATEGFSNTQSTHGALTVSTITITNSATAANNFWGTIAIAIAPGATPASSVPFFFTHMP